jgi:hypothetical protein
MSVYSLDSIREAADKKYGATEIVVDEKTTVRMLNPLRLPKADRDALLATQQKLTGEENIDQLAVFADAIRCVAENKGDAEKLIDAVGDDLAVMAQIFQSYTQGTSAGEASASAS